MGIACGPICLEFIELNNGTTLITNGSEWLATSRSLDEALQDFDSDLDTNEIAMENWYENIDNVTIV